MLVLTYLNTWVKRCVLQGKRQQRTGMHANIRALTQDSLILSVCSMDKLSRNALKPGRLSSSRPSPVSEICWDPRGVSRLRDRNVYQDEERTIQCSTSNFKKRWSENTSGRRRCPGGKRTDRE